MPELLFGARSIDNPTNLQVQTLASLGSGYVLPSADGALAGAGAVSAKAWVYTTLMPMTPFSPPPCAIPCTVTGGNWTVSNLPSPLGNVAGDTPNTLAVWYFAANGTFPVAVDLRYFLGKLP